MCWESRKISFGPETRIPIWIETTQTTPDLPLYSYAKATGAQELPLTLARWEDARSGAEKPIPIVYAVRLTTSSEVYPGFYYV